MIIIFFYVTFTVFVIQKQFRFFLNFFYLMLTLTQFIPALVLGPIFSYMAPLGMVEEKAKTSKSIQNL